MPKRKKKTVRKVTTSRATVTTVTNPRAQPISFIIGRLHGQKASSVESVLFPAAAWSRPTAIGWLQRNGFKTTSLEGVRSGLRARQHSPSQFQPGSLRTIHTSGHAQPLKNPRAGRSPRGRLVVPERELRQAVALYRKFREAEPQKMAVRQFKMPRMLMQVGPAHAIEYHTTHQGKPRLYRHTFAPQARPMLCASHDGRALYFVGGHYDFTRDGIVDR